VKTHLGHYEIVDEIGRGGMGVVYKGFEPALNRFVAIKELSPSLAHDASLVERFLREARSMAALNDPHIIQIYFIGTDEATGQPFFAMEFVDGDSLSGLLKRDGKLSVENALKVLHQTAQGLATAHDRGVIHRDIKPGNLMVTTSGRIKIADFGIALATQDFSRKLTSTGEFVGTPGYLSPEVCTGKTVDQRSDIFSLGIVLYEMLSGTSPFTDESPLGLMLEVVRAEIPDIRAINAEVDADTAAILTRMLAKEPADRFQSCHELVSRLDSHPLIAAGGTIRLAVAKPAASNETMVGAPTPGSQPRQERQATPPPVVGRGGTSANSQPVAAVADASTRASAGGAAAEPVPPPPPAKSRSGLGMGLAIAALLLIMVGVAVAFGGQFLEGFRAGLQDGMQQASAPATEPASAAEPVTPVATAVSEQADAAPAALAVSAVADEVGTMLARVGEATAGLADTLAVEAVAAQQAGVAAAPTGSTDAVVDAALGQAAQALAGAEDAIAAADAGQRTALKAARQTLATATPPPPPRRPDAAPATPRVAVVALGDPALAGPVRQRIERRLHGSGFDLVEASLFVGRDDDLPRALNALRGEATVVVVVQTEPLGQRELQFYGRSDTQYSANLSVRAYSVTDRRPLGPGFSERVDFTMLNADSQAEAALGKHLERVVGELTPFRRRG
jgi:eukaryotic-like serine/threonine-protein kinase